MFARPAILSQDQGSGQPPRPLVWASLRGKFSSMGRQVRLLPHEYCLHLVCARGRLLSRGLLREAEVLLQCREWFSRDFHIWVNHVIERRAILRRVQAQVASEGELHAVRVAGSEEVVVFFLVLPGFR